MARKVLAVEPRQLTGKKVAQMRRTGILPGNIYGRGLDSVSVQIETETLERTLKTSSANEVLDLKVGDEKNLRPAVIHHIQRHPISTKILHADFFQVALGEKMRADIPLVLVGTSEAVKTYNGVVVSGIDILHVEALPLDIIGQIEIDMSTLENLEDSIHVRDVIVPPTLTVLNDPDVVIVKVASPRVAVEAEGEEGEAAPEAAVASADSGAASDDATPDDDAGKG